MKKMVMAAALLLAVPAMAAAQNTVTATATIAASSSVTGSGDLAFGTVGAGGATIDAAGGAGSATRTVSYNYDIRVTFQNVPSALVNGGNSLPVSLTCAVQQGAVWSAASPCSSATFDLDVGTSVTSAVLGFGGTITGASATSAPAGDYSATFDIVVAAQS